MTPSGSGAPCASSVVGSTVCSGASEVAVACSTSAVVVARSWSGAGRAGVVAVAPASVAEVSAP